MNMTKKFLYAMLILAAGLSACKKDKSTSNSIKLTQDQVTKCAESAQPVETEIYTFMISGLVAAIDSGMTITNPPELSGKSAKSAVLNTKFLKNTQGYDWSGPDANGWYIKTYTSLGYTYTESFKAQDSTVWYIFDIEYQGGDGTYSNKTTTQYTQVHKNHKILYEGDSDWQIHTFGDNDISDLEYDFKFSDWDPNTGAGDYDWYWGASSLGGDPVPYHRFLNIIAMDNMSDPPSLHEKITWYDGAVELGSWEYDTYWSPVDMPKIPSMD